MARCSWLICSSLIFLFSSAAIALESLSNGTRTTGNVTQRDGREYDVHPPAPGSANDGLEVQSLSPRPKSLGTGTWKAIKIWNDPVGASSEKRASSPERVIASSARQTADSSILIFFIYPIIRLLDLTQSHTKL